MCGCVCLCGCDLRSHFNALFILSHFLFNIFPTSHTPSAPSPALTSYQAEETFAEVDKTYSEINTELHEMLPNFYLGYACRREVGVKLFKDGREVED